MIWVRSLVAKLGFYLPLDNWAHTHQLPSLCAPTKTQCSQTNKYFLKKNILESRSQLGSKTQSAPCKGESPRSLPGWPQRRMATTVSCTRACSVAPWGPALLSAVASLVNGSTDSSVYCLSPRGTAHGLSRPAACGVFSDQGLNPCPFQVDF